jgi:hypothetical protein
MTGRFTRRGRLVALRGRRATRQRGDPFDVEIHDPLSSVFDARREGVGGLEQRFLRRSFALAVARSRGQPRKERARLRQRHAGLDPGAPRPARGGDHARRVAIAFDDQDGLAFQVRLAPQPRGERKERDENAGETGHQAGLERIIENDPGQAP